MSKRSEKAYLQDIQEARFGRLYETIKDVLSPAGKSLWLATATPMQLDWIEVFGPFPGSLSA